ncbi:MAG: PAS domain S-box protein [Gammaproteobacteria bacterium]|nr:PAS domain S-box protein [Gammaproteobacteria bacterium]MCP5146467.1 PAS domain S-box protein [Gammaproteobacteria bacterium]
MLDASGRLILVSPAISTLLAIQPGDIGKSVADIEAFASDAAFARDVGRAIADGAHAVRLFTAPQRTLLARITPSIARSGEPCPVAIEFLDSDSNAAAPACGDEASYKAIVDGAPSMIWTCDPQGNLDYVNRQWVHYTGLPLAPTPGNSVDELIHPDDRPQAQLAWQRAVKTATSYRDELRIRRHDGEYRWFDTRAVPMRREDGRVAKWFGVATEIEDRRRSLQRLVRSEHRFRNVFEIAPIGILEVDWTPILDFLDESAASAEALGNAFRHAPDIAGKLLSSTTVTGVNPKAIQLFGASGANELIAKISQVFATPAADEAMARAVDALAAGEHGFAAEISLNAIDGRGVTVLLRMAFPTSESGNRVLVTMIDISDAVNAQRIEHKLAQIVNNSFDAITSKTPDGIITSWNPAATRLFGFTEDEVLNRPATQTIVPASHIEEEDAILARINKGETLAQVETRRRHKSGRLIDCAITISPLRDSTGQVTGISTIARDVTEQKRVEAESKVAAMKLQRSNVELERFAYVASHDLQEPLRSIAGPLQLLRKKYRGQIDENADTYIELAVQGAGRMRDIIDGLLAYSRVGRNAATIAPVDVDAVARHVVTILQPAIAAIHAVVEWHELPTLAGQKTLLNQLLQNLISNALKFHGDRQPHITITASRIDGTRRWRFAVRDNGIGFDMKFSEEIFTVFRRLHAHSKYAGTGLGLALCRRVVELHGGRIWAESEPGVGTTMWFELEDGFNPEDTGESV